MLKKSQSWGLSSGLDQHGPSPALISYQRTFQTESSNVSKLLRRTVTTHSHSRPGPCWLTSDLTGSRVWLIILISMGKKNRGMYLVSTSDESLTGCFCCRRQTPRGPFQATSLLLTEKKRKSFSFVYVDTQCRFTEGPKSYSDHGRAEPKLLLAFIVTGRETSQRNPSYAQQGRR